MNGNSTRILFLVGSFPEVSETFVWREAVSLNRLGGVTFLSLAPRTYEPGMFPAEAREVVRHTLFRTLGPRELLSVPAELARRPSVVPQALSMLPPGSTLQHRLGRLYGLARVRRCVRRLGIGVVHAHWRGPTDIAYLNHRLYGTPYTMFLHAHDIYDEGLSDPAYRSLFAAKVAHAARVFTCTAHNVETLREAFPGARIELSYHGVAESLLSEARVAAPVCGPLRLLSVGRLIRYKGFLDLVPLASDLLRRGVDFTWDVIGEGSLRGTLESQIAEHRLSSRVRLHGARPNVEVVQAMREAEILVFLGLEEQGQYGLPNVLLEAAACGLCVVSRPLATLEELIRTGETGYIAGDLHGLVERIVELDADRAAIHRVGEAARGFVARRHRHVRHVERAYRRIAAAAG